MTNDLGKLSTIRPYKGCDLIYVGNGVSLPITHIGDISNGKIHLNDTIVVPKLKKESFVC